MSTVLNLGDPAEEDFSSSLPPRSQSGRQNGAGGVAGELGVQLGEQVAGQVWQAGKKSARRVFDLYANIDILRPYFDVEPWQVRQQLFRSLLPRWPSSSPQAVDSELYGPLMLVFTLVAVLLYGMKSTGHVVREGTLIGTAFGISFLYLFGTATLFFFIAYLINAHISLTQMISLTGYGLFGPCLTLFLAAIIPSDSEMLFYGLWLIFCGLSSLRIAIVLSSRTLARQHALLLGGSVVALHMLFVLYLHFAYAHLYQAAADTMHAMESTSDGITRLQGIGT